MAISPRRISSAVWRFGSLVTVMLVVFPTQPALARPYTRGDYATARCRNLLPDKTGAFMNGVFVPPGASRTVLVSRSDSIITIQLVLTGKPMNYWAVNATYTVPIALKLVFAPRIVFVLELKTCQLCGCEGGGMCLKTPSLLGYFGFQHCTNEDSTAHINDGNNVSVASPSFSELDYLKQIKMVGSADNFESGS